MAKNKAYFNKIVVHSGTFHADDVLCVAYAKYLFPDIEVIRTREPSQEMLDDSNVLVCDVGKRYDPSKHNLDHHNDCPNIPGMDIKKSAIGLMLSDDVVQSAITETLHKNGVIEFGANITDAFVTIQAIDNGADISSKKFYSLIGSDISDALYGFNPEWDSDVSADEAFNSAVQFAMDNFVTPSLTDERLHGQILDNIIQCRHEQVIAQKEAKERAQAMLDESLHNMCNNVVVLPKYCPWDETLVPSDAKFVIFPSNRGGYMLQCVPPEIGSFDKKLELPDWNNSEIKPEGMIFEHDGRFLAQFETKEQAIEAGTSVVLESSKSGKHLPSREHGDVGKREDFVEISAQNSISKDNKSLGE